MAIPLISNVGFTEVSSSGVLNDKAGTAKSKLPIQLFKLSGAISGKLTLNNDSAHKKIIAAAYSSRAAESAHQQQRVPTRSTPTNSPPS